MTTGIRETLAAEAERAPNPSLDIGEIRANGARRRRNASLLRFGGFATFSVVLLISFGFLALNNPGEENESPLATADDVTPANPEPPATANQIDVNVPGLGVFGLHFTGPTGGDLCLAVTAPATALAEGLGGVTLCGEDIAPSVFGLHGYSFCNEVTGAGGAVVIVLGITPNDDLTFRFDGEQQPVTSRAGDTATLYAWTGNARLVGIEIPGTDAAALQAATADLLPLGGCATTNTELDIDTNIDNVAVAGRWLITSFTVAGMEHAVVVGENARQLPWIRIDEDIQGDLGCNTIAQREPYELKGNSLDLGEFYSTAGRCGSNLMAVEEAFDQLRNDQLIRVEVAGDLMTWTGSEATIEFVLDA